VAAVSFVKAQPGLFRVHVEGNDAPNIADAYQVRRPPAECPQQP